MAKESTMFEVRDSVYVNVDQIVLIELFSPEVKNQPSKFQTINETCAVDAVVIHTSRDRPLDYVVVTGKYNTNFRKWLAKAKT